jgi:hypothetical protein
MPWRLIAKAFGWHPRLRRHFTDSEVWKRAVRLSIHAPQPYPADADRKKIWS